MNKRHAKPTTHSIFKRIPALKDRHAVIELGRAHLLIALLAFALLLTLAMSLQPYYVPNRELTIIAIVLLALVGAFSLAVAVALYTKRQR